MQLLNRLWRRTSPSSKELPAERGMQPEEAAMIREVQAHDLAEAKRQRRLQQGVEWAKLNDIEADPLQLAKLFDRPFPGNNLAINNSGKGILLATLLGAGLLAAGLGGGAWGLSQLLPNKSPAAPISQPGNPPGGVGNKTGKPVEIETRDIEAGQLVYKFRWRFPPDGVWSEWKNYDPKTGISVP